MMNDLKFSCWSFLSYIIQFYYTDLHICLHMKYMLKVCLVKPYTKFSLQLHVSGMSQIMQITSSHMCTVDSRVKNRDGRSLACRPDSACSRLHFPAAPSHTVASFHSDTILQGYQRYSPQPRLRLKNPFF